MNIYLKEKKNINSINNSIWSIIFPIQKEEFCKFFSLSAILILMTFCYAITRALKDIHFLSVANTTAIYWLKNVGITPSMVFFTILYGKVTRCMGRDGRFNAVMFYFVIFFIFSFVFLFPQKEVWQLKRLCDLLTTYFPSFIGLWQVICHWPITLFYIHAEAWGVFSISVIFWTLANEITSIDQAKRWFSLLNMTAGLGKIASGFVLNLKNISSNPTYLLYFVVAAMLVILVIYYYFSSDIKARPSYYQIVSPQKVGEEKIIMSFWESLKFLSRSRYLKLLSVLVISYGSVSTLFDAVQKEQMQQYINLKGDKTMYTGLYGQQHMAVGIISLIVGSFFAPFILKKGWSFAAAATPTIALIMIFLFFIFLCFERSLNELLKNFSIAASDIALSLGIYSKVLINSFKYVLFDPTKEAVYIPLDEESKIRGKAALEVVASRLGKGVASILVVVIATVWGKGDIALFKIPLILGTIAIIVIWLYAVQSLGKLKEIVEEQYRKNH